jgi:hypothetical protein
MRVKSIEKHWLPWKEIVLFVADEKEMAILESFLGPKYFYVAPGDEHYVIVPKKWNLKKDDNVELWYLILEDASDFDWGWEI